MKDKIPAWFSLFDHVTDRHLGPVIDLFFLKCSNFIVDLPEICWCGIYFQSCGACFCAWRNVLVSGGSTLFPLSPPPPPPEYQIHDTNACKYYLFIIKQGRGTYVNTIWCREQMSQSIWSWQILLKLKHWLCLCSFWNLQLSFIIFLPICLLNRWQVNMAWFNLRSTDTTCRGVDPGGQLPPQWKYWGGGQTYRFAPPPPNNFDNLKNS